MVPVFNKYCIILSEYLQMVPGLKVAEREKALPREGCRA